MLGRTDRRLRLLVLLVGFGLVAGMLVLRLAYWQVVRGAEMRASAMAQLERSVTQPSVRGDIFDRSGTVVLATTTYRDLLAAYPARIEPADRARVASELTRLLELDVESAAKLTATLQRGGEYAVLFRALTRRQSDAVRAAMDDPDPSRRLDWLDLEPQPVRAYPNEGGAPNTTLASRLLGFTNREGEGQYGIEQRFQDLLGGRPRVMTAQRDVSGRVIADTERLVDPGVPGSDIRLTIDAGLQLMLEKELYAAWVADRAKMASAVVMDPMTGEILAWASVPGYDANDYGRTADEDPSLLIDPIVSEVYEPGSVMKMFVAAAGYDSGAITPTTMVMDSSTLRFGTREGQQLRPPGHGPGHLRGRHRLLAQHRRRSVGPAPRQVGPGRCREPVRHVGSPGHRPQDRRRDGRRGRPAWWSTRPPASGPASTSPTAVSARAWPSPSSSSPRRSRPWSTAARSFVRASSPTSPASRSSRSRPSRSWHRGSRRSCASS